MLPRSHNSRRLMPCLHIMCWGYCQIVVQSPGLTLIRTAQQSFIWSEVQSPDARPGGLQFCDSGGTMGTLVTKLLLPTISSLAFLPTVSIAAKRRFHMEAMVYLFTMFFIAIYHACNGPGLSVLCFMRYDILEYFSIYGTALSMWVSLMALAEFDEPKRSTFVMFGVLTIAVRIYQDRWGYGVYSGPIGTAVLIITAKWLQKMKEKKGLYPDKSVYTQQIGPGFCFGALALMLRFFFEEWDHTYVHSFYHCSLAMSFVLLLPKVNKKAGNAGTPAKLDCSTLCCACI
ncbi:LOW QUALITY PROTEIN: protein myomaker [Trichosurus vulpecula]|uniref:LOW QUALITY PROTEIN: protein myomaker n=1 Tax=Trichosurus vulpecula TaxID=9337 RepID=UPI00186ADE22|nr:LOW QUALITY PROTEIN: protein myomaker [Trichosurus vulpecula]